LFVRNDIKKLCIAFLSIWFTALAGVANAAPLIYADGDLAPLGAPDGLINIADLLVADQILLGIVASTELELSHGDLYPVDAPDGVLNVQDLLLLQMQLLGSSGEPANQYVQNLNLFEDGPSYVSGEVGGNSASTIVTVDGYTGPGATVTNDPNFVDPEDAENTLWHVAVSGGIANAYLGTADLSADAILDTGFDLSGAGTGQLIFDIKVISLSPGAMLTVKIDSGYPDLGQVTLASSRYAVGNWKRVVIDFADLLADPGPGAGLDLNNVVNAFVIEVTGGSADFYLDNIFITHACPQVGGCNATIKTKPDTGGSDTDNDGVPDSLDLCPATPPGTPVDASGCSSILAALSATATASTSGAAGDASLAVDGNPATRWESAHGVDPSWITLDLGAEYELYQVIIDWEAANAATYEIQGSNDNSNWTTLASESGGAFGDRTDIVTLSGTHRYVRMHGLTRTSVYGYSIWQMEVYGSPAADEDGDGIDDSRDLCPGTPPGSTVNADGCIIVDTDNDGVEDSADQCPGTPPATAVDASGCTLVISVNEVSFINGILAGGSGASQPGFTLYVFDNDLAAPGASTCNGGCATSWPPLPVIDGAATGVSSLGTVTRDDGSLQATYAGRPLYFYSGDASVGETNGDGVGGVWHTVPFVQVFAPLFDNTTLLEPAVQEDTPTALITRFADRARDRHAREDQFQIYDHYLSDYWEHRTAAVEIVDTVGKGGDTITFNVTTQWQLSPTEAELRFFYRGIGTVAEYYNNGIMTAVPSLDVPGEDARHYTRSLNYNQKFNRALQVGDRLEFELSQFLSGVPRGRDNYYGTAILYIVGQGVVPWEARGVFGDPATEREDSYPMPVEGWLGGNTTLPYQYSDEPDNHFMQMAGNLSSINGQVFVLGRRVHHTNFEDGSHDEPVDNPPFAELANKLGRNYVNESCVACHKRNGRALPPAVGQTLTQYVVKVGDVAGNPHPQLGAVVQPDFTSGVAEGGVTLSSWSESNGLRSPNFNFTGVTPDRFSARLAPQLVGMGLLEAIDEADIEAQADPLDADGDGISGRMRLVTDPESGETRIGRFGWKASLAKLKHQVAAAFNTDMGVMTSIFPAPDCGAQQSNCGAAGSELSDEHLDNLTAYIALLGVSARRDLDDSVALQGEALFASAGCNACHTDTYQTSLHHPHAELRDQTIHPYTDMLLHDMGSGLTSSLGEGNAEGAEWRTPPLWNIGLTSGVSTGEAFLHDGRARNLHEAIMWHGGEAAAAQQNYDGMSQSEKDAVIAFLQSL